MCQLSRRQEPHLHVVRATCDRPQVGSQGSRKRAPTDCRESVIGGLKRLKVRGVIKVERCVGELEQPRSCRGKPRPCKQMGITRGVGEAKDCRSRDRPVVQPAEAFRDVGRVLRIWWTERRQASWRNLSHGWVVRGVDNLLYDLQCCATWRRYAPRRASTIRHVFEHVGGHGNNPLIERKFRVDIELCLPPPAKSPLGSQAQRSSQDRFHHHYTEAERLSAPPPFPATRRAQTARPAAQCATPSTRAVSRDKRAPSRGQRPARDHHWR